MQIAVMNKWVVVPAQGKPFRFQVAKNFSGIVSVLKDGFMPRIFKSQDDAQQVADELNRSPV